MTRYSTSLEGKRVFSPISLNVIARLFAGRCNKPKIANKITDHHQAVLEVWENQLIVQRQEGATPQNRGGPPRHPYQPSDLGPDLLVKQTTHEFIPSGTKAFKTHMTTYG